MRKANIPSLSQVDVQVNCLTRVLCSIRNTRRLASKHFTLTENGTMHRVSYQSFNVILSNFSPCAADVSRNSAIKQALEVSERVVTAHALKLHPPQSKKKGDSAEISTVLTRKTLRNPTRTQNVREKKSTSAAKTSRYGRTS